MAELTNLAATINREHQLAYDAAFDALEHAILCGEALARARENVADGDWFRWMGDNLDMSTAAAGRYLRIATYREQLLGAEDRPQSINAAVTYLKDIEAPPITSGRNGRRPTFDVSEAKRLKKLGLTNKDIGKMLGVSDVAIWRQLTPGATDRAVKLATRARSKRRAKAYTEAQRQQNREMADIGGPTSDAYFLLRQCAETLDRAIDEATGDAQHDLRKALTHVHRAEDAVIRSVDLQPRRRRA